jgi:LysR family transcriptional regulator (chromosome initiation inhibitor)
MFLFVVQICLCTVMRFAPERLEALVAIIDEGTFEAAARRLHVTPSAISQRIRALESEAGQVLLRRSSPCVPTPAGEPLVRLGRQLRLLEREAILAVPGADNAVVELTVAVNADSLATWFRGVLAEVASWDGAALVLAVEDQEYADRLLRRGEVIAAVTSNPTPVQGCTAEPLGQMRYTPAATPRLVERFSENGDFAWERAPVVVFNDKDHLQDKALAARGHERPPVVHRVPTSAEFHEAVRRGLGWGMVPQAQLEPDQKSGILWDIKGGPSIEVPLHWQRWRFDSTILDNLTATVRSAANRRLPRS